MSQIPNPWISARPDRPEAALRLFCFPHAGASAAVFRPWIRALPKHVDLCRFEPPGRFGRPTDPAIDDMESFLNSFDGAAGQLLDRPFAVFGYSLGAIMAFEWARLVRSRRGVEPVCLIVAARGAPHLNTPMPIFSDLPDAELLSALERR